MPSLSDKLKSLGVRLGPADLPLPHPRSQTVNLLEALGVLPISTLVGDTFILEQYFPPGYIHGRAPLSVSASLNTLANWVGDARLRDLPAQAFAFLDTETTGLQGGTGTFAFLIGVGRFEADTFHLAQFFMQDPAAEPAQLAALEAYLAPCQALVTYNGKAFDIPLLNTRYISHGLTIPYIGYAHVDLLHLARRLWRDRLPSRTLSNIEAQILGSLRTSDDVPGWMIPQLYFDYLRSGDPAPLKSVFYHNAMDVISLAALLNHTAGLLENPLSAEVQHGIDMVSLAKLFEDLGDLEMATRLYIHGMRHLEAQDAGSSMDIYLQAIQRLAAIYKRQGNYPAAVELWQEAAANRHLDSNIELAKYYEHRLRDVPTAIYWTRTAILTLEGLDLHQHLRQVWLAELEHRLERLKRKHAGQETE